MEAAKIGALEWRGVEIKVEEHEQYSRIDNVIISGLRFSAVSYAQAAGGADEKGGRKSETNSVEI